MPKQEITVNVCMYIALLVNVGAVPDKYFGVPLATIVVLAVSVALTVLQKQAVDELYINVKVYCVVLPLVGIFVILHVKFVDGAVPLK